MARSSFRTMLTGLLVVMVAFDVGGLAILAYRAGHQAIDHTTLMLSTEVEDDISEELSLLLDRPVRMIRSVERRVIRDELSFDDLQRMQHAFADTLLATPTVSFFGFVHADGRGIWLEQGPDSHDVRRVWQGPDGWRQEAWAINAAGEAGAPLGLEGAEDPRSQPWFQAAVASAEPVWAELHPHGRQDALALDVCKAVRDDQGRLIGVLQSGFVLSELEDDLARLAESHDAIAFLSDPSGGLVVTHEGRSSESPVVLAAAASLVKHGEKRRIEVDGLDYDVFSHEMAAALPASWTLLVAVPRDRFAGPMTRHFQEMAALTALALLLAVSLAWVTGRRMSRPLIDVAAKARMIPEGGEAVELGEGSSLREVNDLIQALREMIRGLSERDRMKDAFARYVSPALMERVLHDPEALRPGGRLSPAVVMFSDLRGYTALTARLGAEGTVAVINRYLDRMIAVIDAHGGWVTDVMGDGLLIVFAMEEPAAVPRRAVRCAVAMQEALERFAVEVEPEIGVRLEMGIGLHMGDVVIGNIGSATKVKYGVVGDAVNTAARVESLTVGGEVLVSEPLRLAIGDDLDADAPREVPVKGKVEPLRVYGVRALRGADGLALASTEPVSWRAVSVIGKARRVLGKEIGREVHPVEIVAVEDRHLRVRTEAELNLHDDVRIDVGDKNLYGRVRGVASDGALLLRWTGGAQSPAAMFPAP